MRLALLTACLWLWAVPVIAQTFGPCPYVSPSGVSAPVAIGGVVQGANTYDFGKLADVQRYTAKIQQLVQWGFTVEITALNTPKKQVTIKATCVGVLVVAPPVEPPPPPPPPSGASADGTVVPPAASLIDSAGHVWTLGAAPDSAPSMRYVLCDGHLSESGFATAIRYLGGVVQTFGSDRWWSVSCGAAPSTGGGETPPPPPTGETPVTKTRTLLFVPVAEEYAIVTRFLVRILDGVSGATAYASDLGKPPLTAGEASVPLTLTLIAGRVYAVSVAACSIVECGYYSAGTDVVF